MLEILCFRKKKKISNIEHMIELIMVDYIDNGEKFNVIIAILMVDQIVDRVKLMDNKPRCYSFYL
jgi:hypothetical protein